LHTVLKQVFVLLVVPLLLAACATSSGRVSRDVVDTGGGRVSVEVQNDALPPASLTLQLLSPRGQRTILGALASGRTRVFPLRETSFSGMYRLMAEGGGARVTSTPFALFSGAQVIWNLRDNSLRVLESVDPTKP
jgi:predicted small secreted protein